MHDQAVVVEQARQHGLVGRVVHDDGAVGGHEAALFATRLRGGRAGQPQDVAPARHVRLQARRVGVRQGVALVEVALVEGAGGEGLAQGAVGGERDPVEQVREAELAGFLGPGVQDGPDGGGHQQGPARGLAGHVAQAHQGLAQAHGQGHAGQPPAAELGQHLVLQGLFTGRGGGNGGGGGHGRGGHEQQTARAATRRREEAGARPGCYPATNQAPVRARPPVNGWQEWVRTQARGVVRADSQFGLRL